MTRCTEIIVEFPSQLTEREKKMIYGYKGEIVRCEYCIHYWKNHLKDDYDDTVAVCLASPKDDAFCSEGERRKEE